MPSPGFSDRHLVCTIIAPNYLPQFLVLARSLATFMPTTALRVLILQDCADTSLVQANIDHYLLELRSGADHRALTIDDCEWGDFDAESAALFYNVLELATSLKPALLRSFLRDGWDRVTYLDPDVQVFGDFTTLLDDAADLSLTPHFMSDIPSDGFRPSTNDILLAGLFNLGFCSVRPSAAPFLCWWSDRLQFDCLEDHLAGLFTDQKIVDLAPLKANVQILRVPGCNVAYWNLHERRIEREDDQWRVRYREVLEPLYFFHFSGFVLKGTPSLSRHATRKVLGDMVPRAFANQYDRQLRREDPESDVAFTLGGAPLDHPVPALWRRFLREDAQVHVRAGRTLRQVREEIYAPRCAPQWLRCLTCGKEHANFGTRTLALLVGWSSHPSLVGVPNAISAYSRQAHHQFHATAMEQLSWAKDHLENEWRGNAAVLDEVLVRASDALRHCVDLKLIGYFAYPAGIGQIARWTLQTLEAAGLMPALESVFAVRDDDHYLSQLLQRHHPVAAANASVLCLVNADQWEQDVTTPRRINPKVQHVEVVWAWELEAIPLQMLAIASSGSIERVHALSNWGAQAMAKVLPLPVQRFAPFDLALLENLPRLSSNDDGRSGRSPYVLATFDAKSFLSRKNPDGILALWQRVCEDFPDHSLILKSADLRDLASPELLDRIDASERTVLVDEHLGDDRYADLLAHCAVFISLHRSEGMGLTPIEAGLCARPVVYTNYGGVTDFLDEGFYPVSYDLALVGDSHAGPGPYEATAWWAEPDMGEAERQLRRALGPNAVAASALDVDRQRLVHNLEVAHAEVIATAERLLVRARTNEHRDEYSERMATLAIDLVPPPVVPAVPIRSEPEPNPVLFAVVAASYWLYRRLPAAFRRHVNLAVRKVRSQERHS